MKRRTQLVIRQSLAYRSGQSADDSWFVGYWDKTGKRLPADQAFRSFGSKKTSLEAEEFAKQIVASHKEFFYL